MLQRRRGKLVAKENIGNGFKDNSNEEAASAAKKVAVEARKYAVEKAKAAKQQKTLEKKRMTDSLKYIKVRYFLNIPFILLFCF